MGDRSRQAARRARGAARRIPVGVRSLPRVRDRWDARERGGARGGRCDASCVRRAARGGREGPGRGARGARVRRGDRRRALLLPAPDARGHRAAAARAGGGDRRQRPGAAPRGDADVHLRAPVPALRAEDDPSAPRARAAAGPAPRRASGAIRAPGRDRLALARGGPPRPAGAPRPAADRSPRAGRRGPRRWLLRARAPPRVRALAARALPGSQPPRRRRVERALVPPALRARLGARGVRARRGEHRLDDREARHEGPRQARGLLERQRARRRVPRRARHLARDRPRARGVRDRHDHVRGAPRVRAHHARGPRGRSTSAPLRPLRARGGSHARPRLERRDATAPRGGPHPELPAHALGQEDPRVVGAWSAI